MAWYKCGGGGIPSNLKTGMNGVLNKKFGTSSEYAPDTWVDNVNLLGKLPEKTVSGSIAHITDGADRVPMKNLVCNIEPIQAGSGTPSVDNPRTISGSSSVEIIRTTANLLDGEWETGWIANDGSISPMSGRIVSANYNPCVGGVSYYIKCADNWRLAWFDKDKQYISHIGTYTSDRTVTSPANARFVRVALPVTTTEFACVNYPSTIATQQPYNTPEIKTVPLGQTVYGGSLDVVTCVLTIDRITKTFTGDSSETWTKYHQTAENCITFRTPMTDKAMVELSTICDKFNNIKNCWTLPNEYGVFSDHKSQNLLFFRPFTDDITEVAQWRSWLAENNITICYKLAEPQTVQLTPQELQTLLGANNIWNNTGDTSVTYRRDIELALEEV